MFLVRWRLLQYALHSFAVFTLSFRTIALAAVKEIISLRLITFGSYPSQSGIETHPLSRYTLFGATGMLRGRWPDLYHSLHSFSPPSLSFRTIALASAKGSILPGGAFELLYPRKSGQEVQPSSWYILSGDAGMLADRRFPDLLHTSHAVLLPNLIDRTKARASVKESQ